MRDHAAYPRHWEADVVLRDGETAHLRPITPGDADALQRFHQALSPQSVHLRFFGPMPETLSPRQLEEMTTVDHVDRVALVVLSGDELIGVCRYERLDAHEAEVAFAVLDAYHGRGLGSVFLEHLAAAAREHQIWRFVADVLPENTAMLNVFREAGYRVGHHLEDGVVALVCDLDPTERSVAVMESREHRFESASLNRLLNPSSVAVVGASRNPDTISGRVLSHLLGSGFGGEIHVVNPHAPEVQGVRAHARVTDLPGPVDVAVVLVPPAAVLDVVHDCARARVHGLVMMSSGDDSDDERSLERQREIVRLSRTHGMRVIGPSSMGILNTDPAVRLNASLVARMPPAGGLALFSQSGALGAAVVASATRRRLGISSFVSAGNRADVSTNDCMQYWEDDPNTEVLGLYLESIGNPRKFSRIARRVAQRKPIVAVKSGVSGHAVPPGHGVRRTRAPRAAVDSLMHQAGVIRVDTMHQLFDVAQLLLHQPLPGGERLGIVANSRAMAVLVADAATGWGLRAESAPVITRSEPTPEEFRQAIHRGFTDLAADVVVVCYVPPLGAVHADIPLALQEISARTAKTAAACVLGLHGVVGSDRGRAFPAYPTPEDAVKALALVVRYARRRRDAPGRLADPSGLDRARARRLVADRLGSTPEGETVQLDGKAAAELLACYGVQASDASEDGERMSAGSARYVLHTMEDELFGPVLSLGIPSASDGLAAGRRAHRIPPLTDTDVADLVDEVDGTGRGTSGPGGRAALTDVVTRVACLADDLPEVAELDLAVAVAVTAERCVVAVEGVKLTRQVGRADRGLRSLTSWDGPSDGNENRNGR